jgi:geranylgeranyl diphosphate synthase type I
MTSFSPPFEALRQQVDDVMLRFLADRRHELAESQTLFDEIERMVRAGGKRIRPSFCYWGYRAAGREHHDNVVIAAAALELLHTFALIHDDVMDEASERRGLPTVHHSYDVPTAILAGDLALVLADDLLMKACEGSDALGRTFEVYSRMRREVIAGQYLDIRSAHEVITEERARRIAVLKSGRYSVVEPLLVGAALAGAETELCETLTAFGEPLGEAFQLKDDLLGIFGDPSATGKPIDSDIREGKRNVLFAKTIAALTGSDRDFFVARWGGEGLTEGEIDRLRSFVGSSGAREAVEELVLELRFDAENALGEDIEPGAREALRELVAVAVARDR